ncbi:MULTISPECIES: ABC transporter permease [Thermoactinomyces]|jgi:peptide/nickel transport system permease protein|uniref:ABC transporter permease n=1 Tax=Thermoactinomyces daqus TaxID=1329516 RepID=A0A7W1X7M9_9BACL|nr:MULTISPECIES: ABC transporter permease [Thermoactinomyces]MBA4541479.1 ABC transporter permease [Thermoactinomyces daqus]MBH8596955.1 ABC transporter permease [Thermoactinomyces sp. CICC 10523]MBH8603731.1 ABC transporter permease [Thermoactinomyces sp. CICC 10522]MBH8607634.1 ABC transporter permease [Thermoactinomyces sp. CICC 10521]
MSRTAADSVPTPDQTQTRRESQWEDFFRRFARNKLAVAGAVIFVFLILTAVFAPWISTHDPIYDQDYSAILQSPGHNHLLGTDDLGRDTFSRLVYGARLSLEAAVVSVGIALVIGVPIGLVCGYFRGFWDEWIVMRIVDAMQAFPSLILALAMAAVLGGGFGNAIIAIGIGFIPSFVRITRSQVMSVTNQEFVQAARAVGANDWRIMFLHVLPNSLAPILVQTTLAMASAIIAEAGLSYLGLGAKPEEPSWGSMLNVAQGYLTIDPLLAFWPGLAIFLVVLGFNLLGDGIREVLDPKLDR